LRFLQVEQGDEEEKQEEEVVDEEEEGDADEEFEKENVEEETQEEAHKDLVVEENTPTHVIVEKPEEVSKLQEGVAFLKDIAPHSTQLEVVASQIPPSDLPHVPFPSKILMKNHTQKPPKFDGAEKEWHYKKNNDVVVGKAQSEQTNEGPTQI